MKTLSQKIALAFAVINLIPAIFGVIMIQILIPVPGLILYIYYWVIFRGSLSINGERIVWVSTILYNLLLVWIGNNEKDIFDENIMAYQLISSLVAAIAFACTFSTEPSSEEISFKETNQ